MSAQTTGLNFIRFAKEPVYQQVNRGLVETALSYVPSTFHQVDVATGTGLVPQLVAQLCEEQGRHAIIIGVDPDPFALAYAREQTKNARAAHVTYVEGFGQNLKVLLAGRIPEEGVDYTSIHDAIHEIPTEEDKRAVFNAMAQVLKPGGVLSYNSAFTVIGMGESAFGYGQWKMDAIKSLGERRNKSIEAIAIHHPDEYETMLKDSGLTIIHSAVRPVILTRDALEAIAQYPGFVEGVFRDMTNTENYPLEVKSKALIESLDRKDITGLDRIWHEVVARKPE